MSNLQELREPGKAAENAYFRVGKWRGMDNYECKHCPFITLEKAAMEKHIDKHRREGTLKELKKPAAAPPVAQKVEPVKEEEKKPDEKKGEKPEKEK